MRSPVQSRVSLLISLGNHSIIKASRFIGQPKGSREMGVGHVATLDYLEQEGLVNRVAQATFPPHVTDAQ